MKNRRFPPLILAISMMMSLALAACGTSNNQENSAGNVSQEPTEVVSVSLSPEESASSAEAYRTVTNIDGTEITVPLNVERIGCLFGPSYEKVVVLGAEDKVVFDGDFHIYSWPWSNMIYQYVNDVPGIENAHSEPNIEDLVTYSPDVVFNFPNPTTTETMEAAGMCVVPSASTGAYDDIVKMLAVYAEVIGGGAIANSDRYAEYFYDMTDMIAERVADVPEDERPTVYFANQEILKCSNKTDLIERCGGIAVASDITGNSVEIDKEQLIEWNPDYIFVDHAGSSGNATAEEVIAEMLADPVYNSISAVANDSIIIVPTGVFFWDSGVQQPLLMLLLAQTMYPDLFSDMNMKDTLIGFYSEFYYYDLTGEQADLILAHMDPIV